MKKVLPKKTIVSVSGNKIQRSRSGRGAGVDRKINLARRATTKQNVRSGSRGVKRPLQTQTRVPLKSKKTKVEIITTDRVREASGLSAALGGKKERIIAISTKRNTKAMKKSPSKPIDRDERRISMPSKKRPIVTGLDNFSPTGKALVTSPKVTRLDDSASMLSSLPKLKVRVTGEKSPKDVSSVFLGKTRSRAEATPRANDTMSVRSVSTRASQMQAMRPAYAKKVESPKKASGKSVAPRPAKARRAKKPKPTPPTEPIESSSSSEDEGSFYSSSSDSENSGLDADENQLGPSMKISSVRRGGHVVLRNLPKNVTPRMLIMELFRKDGEIIKAVIHADENGQSLGTGEVIFSKRREAKAAVRKHRGTEYRGKRIRLTMIGRMIEEPKTYINTRRQRRKKRPAKLTVAPAVPDPASKVPDTSVATPAHAQEPTPRESPKPSPAAAAAPAPPSVEPVRFGPPDHTSQAASLAGSMPATPGKPTADAPNLQYIDALDDESVQFHVTLKNSKQLEALLASDDEQE